MTFREYCTMAINHDFEFDAIIGNEDMPATFGFTDDMVFTPYCEEKYGELLSSEVTVHNYPRQTEVAVVEYDNARVGEQFAYAVAGYIPESEWDKLFANTESEEK